MRENFSSRLHIPDHPFYIGLVAPDSKTNVPECLPFNMCVHPHYTIPRLQVTSEIRAALDLAYSEGSMCSTPLGESPLAVARMNEVANKILKLFRGDIAGKKFLEIGCGNGELLNHFKQRGALVTGLEIGPQAEVVEQRYGVKVIRNQLGIATFKDKFDCIYSYGCLEHIDDLESFFEACRYCLNDGGLFFHSVPNAALSFEKGQLDHLLHEHINYFTPLNGTALFAAQGFRSGGYALSKPGNELMLWGYLEATADIRWPEECIEREAALLEKYSEDVRFNSRRIYNECQKILNDGKSLGFYAGGYEYGYRLNHADVRYFDGDSYKHGKCWLKSLPSIEAPESIIEASVDYLVVCKPHYFSEISRDLIRLGISKDSILNMDTLGL